MVSLTLHLNQNNQLIHKEYNFNDTLASMNTSIILRKNLFLFCGL